MPAEALTGLSRSRGARASGFQKKSVEETKTDTFGQILRMWLGVIFQSHKTTANRRNRMSEKDQANKFRDEVVVRKNHHFLSVTPVLCESIPKRGFHKSADSVCGRLPSV